MREHMLVTILLVEDDDIDAQGIERSLKKRKIANPVVRANDGLEALEILETGQINSPYVVLLDLQMPRMNGLEFLEKIRAHPTLDLSVVFVLTTSQSEDDIIAAYKNHIAGYFVKDDVGHNFDKMLDMLEGYWRIAYLPD